MRTSLLPLLIRLRQLSLAHVNCKFNHTGSLMKTFIVATLILLTSFTVYCQLPDVEWQFSQNQDYFDQIEQVIQTSDGGYVIAGRFTDSYGFLMKNSTVLAKKISSTGAQLWSTNLLDRNYYIPTLCKPLELRNNTGYLVRGDWFALHSLDPSTGTILETIVADGEIVGYLQLNDGKIGVLYLSYLSNNGGNDYGFKLLDENLSQIWDKTFGESGDDEPTGLALGLDGQSFVMTGNSNSTAGAYKSSSVVGGWTIAIDINGNKLWDSSTTNSISAIMANPSKIVNHYPGETSIENKKGFTRSYGSDDYVYVGTSAGTSWIGGGKYMDYSDISTTFAGTINSVSVTLGGDLLVALSDSIVMLNNNLERVWKTADYADLGIESTSDGGFIIYGGSDFRLIKLNSRKLVSSDLFYLTGLLVPVSYQTPKIRTLKYMNGSFTDLDKNGSLDLYLSALNESGEWLDDIRYTYNSLTGYLKNTSSQFDKILGATDTQYRWGTPLPTNFHFDDFDNDGSLELFNNKTQNVNPTTGVQALQTTNLTDINFEQLSNIQWADFDNNGLLDAFINLDAIYLQTAVNFFSRLNTSSTFAGLISSPILIDINNDGFVDVIDKQGKAIYLNQNMTFTKQAALLTHTPSFPVELNGDGWIDFIGYTNGTYYTFINNGNLTFTYKNLNLSNPTAVGDINNDGKTDLSAAGPKGYYIYFNDGAGNFNTNVNYDYYVPSSFGLNPLVLPGDTDDDGDLDFAIVDSYQILFLKNEQTTPNPAPTVPTGMAATRSGNTTTLTWNQSSDNNTPQSALTYNVYLKNGSQTIVNSNSIIPNGKRILVNEGNAGLARLFKITGLPVGTYQWGVQTIDKGLKPSAFSPEQTLYITNNPTNIALSNSTIVENSAAAIGTFATTDPDAGETFTYSLVTGTGSTDNTLFKVTGNALSALTASSLNFETKPSYSIRIRTTDNRQGFFEKVFTITVTNVQEAATDILLSATSIEENKPIGSEIATITNNDPDAGDVHLFTLVSGTGSTDNSQFEIVGNKLRSKAIFNYEIKSSYSIRIRTNDQQGQTFEKSFSILIIDLNDLTKPVLSLPSLISQTGFTLSWAAIEGASTYELEISTGNFSDFITDYDPKVISGNSATVAGLTPGIIYKIRVRAVHLTFKSSNSDEIAQITKPANPVALDPAQIDVTSFKAGWTAPVGTDSYEFELSEGAGVFTTLPDYPKTVTGGALDLVVTDLTAKTVYKYRVRAVNSAGASGNSNEKSVETLQVQNSNPLSLSAPVVSSSKISVNVTGGSGTRLVKFYSKTITASTSSFVEKVLTATTDAFETTVSTTNFDELGLEYYFTAFDGSVTTPIETAHGYIYQTVGLNTFSAIPFSTRLNGSASTYEMFSVPYEITEKSIASNFDELGAPDKTQWRLLRYQGGKYIEYPDNITTLDIGKGYWFNALQKVDIKTGEGKVTSANQTSPFTITFAQGWNQIGNPYPFNIDWEAMKNANTAAGLNSLWLFEGGKYLKKDVLATWKGAFVFSDTGGSVSFPVTAKTTSPGRTAKEELTPTLDEAAWQLPIKLSLNGLEQISAVGMHPEARASKDKFDEITIPRFIDYLEMNTYHEEFFAHHFASDMVTTTNETSWLFTVSSNQKEGVATLTWNQQALLGNQSKIALIDLQEQTLIDMKTTNTYQFNWSEGRQFKILYSREGELLPGVTMLGNAYPNPFITGTTIPFLLEEDQTRVEISIYDLLGRKVKTLNQQNNKAGIHSMEWNGNNEQGTAVDGGLYLYQLRGDKGILSPPKRLIKQ